MRVLLLIAALMLVGIGLDIFRFPKLRKLTQREQEKYVFGEQQVSEFERNWMARRTYFASGNAMRYLAILLISCGLALAAKALEVI